MGVGSADKKLVFATKAIIFAPVEKWTGVVSVFIWTDSDVKGIKIYVRKGHPENDQYHHTLLLAPT